MCSWGLEEESKILERVLLQLNPWAGLKAHTFLACYAEQYLKSILPTGKLQYLLCHICNKYRPIWKALSTLATRDRLIAIVQLLHVDLEVSLAATGGGAELTLEHWLVA